LALAAAVAVPAVAHALIQRRLRPPDAPRWGRTHRYAGHLGSVAFQQLGSGPPIVLLHAFGPGFDAQQWHAAAEALAPRFRIYVPDLPGWGWGCAAAARLGPEVYPAILADFLTGVLRDPAILVGAGLAAAAAVRVAAEHPDRIRALALVNPTHLPDCLGQGADGTHTGMASAAADGPGYPPLAQLLGVPLLQVSLLDLWTSRALLGHYLRTHAYAAPERVDAALLEHHYRVSHLPAHRQALAAYWRGELDLSAGEALPRLRMPVWITCGAGRPGAHAGPVESGLAHLPPGSRIEIFAGSRELPHAEQPLAWSVALGRFVAQLPAA